ncbi:MAG: TetR/AcrR family transcriptional regulator [Chitinophagales bacterium]|nr:TetR/AcrR family transcriptional regulator [Chitinophagales bacterium]
MTIEQQILAKSTELFIKYGLKNLTMDEIARELGMSKKTIYQYCENKADLIEKSMRAHIKKEECDLVLIEGKAKNAIDETLLMFEYIMDHIRGVSGNMIYEMQKYYPKAYALFNEYTECQIQTKISKNLARGIEEGFYRSDMNPDIVSKIYISAVVFLFDQKLFPVKQYAFPDLYREFMTYHLHGILSVKGLKYVEQKKLVKK